MARSHSPWSSRRPGRSWLLPELPKRLARVRWRSARRSGPAPREDARVVPNPRRVATLIVHDPIMVSAFFSRTLQRQPTLESRDAPTRPGRLLPAPTRPDGHDGGSRSLDRLRQRGHGPLPRRRRQPHVDLLVEREQVGLDHRSIPRPGWEHAAQLVQGLEHLQRSKDRVVVHVANCATERSGFGAQRGLGWFQPSCRGR
jgi:hypothetical protein